MIRIPIRVYLAARYGRRVELAGYREALRAFGFEVTSRWLDGYDALDGSAQGREVDRQRFARQDLKDVMRADWVINFTELPRELSDGCGGRHVEFGVAIGCGKSCFVVGPAENIFHTLPGLHHFETWAECFEVMGKKVSAFDDYAP